MAIQQVLTRKWRGLCPLLGLMGDLGALEVVSKNRGSGTRKLGACEEAGRDVIRHPLAADAPPRGPPKEHGKPEELTTKDTKSTKLKDGSKRFVV